VKSVAMTNASAAHAAWFLHGWLTSLTGRLFALAALILAVTAIWKFFTPAIRAGWLRLTRRRRLTLRLRQLACGMQIEHFVHLLRQPAQYVDRPHNVEETEHVFVLPEAYVQAVTDAHGKVGLFAVTTRDKRFHPRLNYHPGGASDMRDVELGRTRFSELVGLPTGVRGWLAARRFGYAETYYFGNPGYYQTYVVALNDAGYLADISLVSAIGGDGGTDLNWFPGLPVPAPRRRMWSQRPVAPVRPEPGNEIARFLTSPAVQSFRTDSVINTYAVISTWMERRLQEDTGSGWGIRYGIGPDHDVVRTAPIAKRTMDPRRLWGRSA
jgi:hypothetical protein